MGWHSHWSFHPDQGSTCVTTRFGVLPTRPGDALGNRCLSHEWSRLCFNATPWQRLAVSSVRQSLHHRYRISIRDGRTRVSRPSGPCRSAASTSLVCSSRLWRTISLWWRSSTATASTRSRIHGCQCLVLKTRMFQFRTIWQKGSQHAVADALSHAPVTTPTADDTLGEEDPQYASPAIRACLRHTDSSQPCLSFVAVQNAAKADPEYQQLVDTVTEGFSRCTKQVARVFETVLERSRATVSRFRCCFERTADRRSIRSATTSSDRPAQVAPGNRPHEKSRSADCVLAEADRGHWTHRAWFARSVENTNTTTAQHPCPSTNCSSEHF